MFISFYITDSQNRLLFQYLLNANSPVFKHFWAKVKSQCPQLVSGTIEVDASRVDGSSEAHGFVGRNLEVFKYHSSINSINYWCLTSETQAATQLVPFILLETIDKELLQYFDKDRLTSTKIVNNYDRISMIFYSCLNGGEAAAGKIYSNAIKDIVPPRSDLSKIISSTTHNIQRAVQKSSAGATPSSSSSMRVPSSSSFSPPPPPSLEFTSMSSSYNSVPWRSSNINYLSDEIYLDMVEQVYVVYQKTQKRKSASMQIINGYIEGYGVVRSYLSGMPLVELVLDTAGNHISLPSLHECVEHSTNDNSSDFNMENIKFIPPDGKFTLFDYCIDLDDTPRRTLPEHHHTNYGNNLGMVSANFVDGLGISEDEFEVTVNVSSSRVVKHIKNLRIGLKASILRQDSLEFGYEIKILRNTHGRFEMDMDSCSGIWIFDQETETGILPILRGCIVAKGDPTKKPSGNASGIKVGLQTVTMSYEYSGQLPSGMNVKSINILSGLPSNKKSKLFKGVKYEAEVKDFELRT